MIRDSVEALHATSCPETNGRLPLRVLQYCTARTTKFSLIFLWMCFFENIYANSGCISSKTSTEERFNCVESEGLKSGTMIIVPYKRSILRRT